MQVGVFVLVKLHTYIYLGFVKTGNVKEEKYRLEENCGAFMKSIFGDK